MPDTILTDKALKSETQEDENKKEKENEKEKENGNENENDETIMSSKDDDDKKNENEDDDKDDDDYDDDDDDDETMRQNKKNEIIKGKNGFLNETIDKSKSFEEQIKSLKKEKILKGIGLITILVIKS